MHLRHLFLPKVSWDDRTSLPEEPGIYYCYSGFTLLYIGKSKNLRERWGNNNGYGKHHHTAELEYHNCTHIHFEVEWDKERMDCKEAIGIRDLNPPLNRKLEPVDRWEELKLNLDHLWMIIGVCISGYKLLPVFFNLFSR